VRFSGYFSVAPAAHRRHFATAAMAVLVSSTLVVVGSQAASAAVTPVLLGTADSFAVLAGAGVTGTGPNTLTGDLGTFPTTTVTGTGTITITGTNHGGDGVTQGAKTDLVTAYDVAAAEGPTSPIVADLAGQTLPAGIYNSGSQISLTGVLTLDAAGDPDAMFVFQAGSDLIVGPGATVVLTNGAQACNVFWQVTSSASLDTSVSFKGSILALTSITLNTGATVEGRLLARNGNVTLDTNTVTVPFCAEAVVPTSAPVAPGGSAPVVPVGGVSTGDGSAVSGTSGVNPVLPALAFIGIALAGVAGYLGSRRRFHTV